MMSRSQRTSLRQADDSQSERPRSTSSTKSNSSAGRYRRNVSFSSAELTVIVQTVFFSARASLSHATVSRATVSSPKQLERATRSTCDESGAQQKARQYRTTQRVGTAVSRGF